MFADDGGYRRIVGLSFLLTAALTPACGGDEAGDTDDSRMGVGGAGDDSPPVLIVACEKDGDCPDDGNACNGEPSCNDGQCQPGKRIDCDDGIGCTIDYCRSEDGSCVHEGPDRDGDGHVSASCLDQDDDPLGDDCDDEDPFRYPGNAEYCTLTEFDHDEDCDPKTFGGLDEDGDEFVNDICVNFDEETGEEFRGRDCNDRVANISPENTDACDGFDNDCDGEIDEGQLIVGYRDQDGDGVGVFVTEGNLRSGDIVDDSGRLLYCPGTPATTENELLTEDDADCDDQNPMINPNRDELCDEIDNDCDGEVDEQVVAATWYADFDGDGFGNPRGPLRVSCEPQIGYSLLPTDCDDTNPLANPAQEELCDGVDNDCDGTADFLVGPGNLEDDDNDGYADPLCGTSSPDCDDDNELVHPGAVELCDEIDNDCNGLPESRGQSVVWYLDADGDGYGNPLGDPIDSCEVIKGRVTKAGDCDDTNPDRHPGKADDCTGISGFDDNCDGVADEDEVAQAYFRDKDEDGFGDSQSEPLFACVPVVGWAKTAGDCDDTNRRRSPHTPEDCSLGQGVDDDCDGLVDCADPDCKQTDDCLGLYELVLVNPTPPVVATVATPFTARVFLRSSENAGVGGLDLSVDCKDGASTSTPSVQTESADGEALLTGEAEITIVPGLSLGTYQCEVSVVDSHAVPLTIDFQAVAPPRGTVHPVVNAKQLQQNATSGVSSLDSGLYNPVAIAIDADGTLYVLDRQSTGYSEVVAVSARGTVEKLFEDHSIPNTLVATGYRLAVDSQNDILYISSSTSSGSILRYDLTGHTVVTWVGGGSTNYFDGMLGSELDIGIPHALSHRAGYGLAFIDDLETLYLVSDDGTLVRQPTDACGGRYAAIQQCNATNCGIALTESGSFLSVADWCPSGGTSGADALGRVDSGVGVQTLLSTTGTAGGNLPLSQTTLTNARDIELDSSGNAFLIDAERVRFIHRRRQIAYDLIGGATPGTTEEEYGDYGPASAALLNGPRDTAVGPDGSVYVVSAGDRRVRRVWRPNMGSDVSSAALTLTSDEPTAVAGYRADPIQLSIEDQQGDPLPGVPIAFENTASSFGHQGPTYSTSAGLVSANLMSSMSAGTYQYFAIAEDLQGTVMATETFDVTVNRPGDGIITTILNQDKSSGTLSNSVWAPEQKVGGIYALESASDGLVYFSAYSSGYRIYTLHPGAHVTHIAGGGSVTPDSAGALSASLGAVISLQLDEPNGLLYLLQNNRLMVLDLNTEIITTIATPTDAKTGALSSDGTQYFFADDVGVHHVDLTQNPAIVSDLITTTTSATTNCEGNPQNPFLGNYATMAWAEDGLLYLGGQLCTGTGATTTYSLYSFDPSDASIVELAAIPATSYYGDGAFDENGVLHFAVHGSPRVYRFAGGVLETVAGTGSTGTDGDLGIATAASFSGSRSIDFTPEGDLLIAVEGNLGIKKVWLPGD